MERRLKRLQKEADDFLRVPNIYHWWTPAYGNDFFEYEIIKRPEVQRPNLEKPSETTKHIPYVLSLRRIKKILDIKQPGAFIVKPTERGKKLYMYI